MYDAYIDELGTWVIILYIKYKIPIAAAELFHCTCVYNIINLIIIKIKKPHRNSHDYRRSSWPADHGCVS